MRSLYYNVHDCALCNVNRITNSPICSIITAIDVYQATTNRTASEPEHSDELKSEETVIGQR